MGNTKQKPGFSPFLKAVLINAAVMAVLFACMLPVFESNDDPVMANMVNGAKMSSDPHLVFQNVILGLILKGLYAAAGSLPWYSLLQYALIFASLTAITWVILCRIQGIAGYCLSALFLVYLGYACYIRLQFTKTAGIGACAGVLLAASWLTWCRKKRVLAAAAVLFFMGFLYRFREAGACAVLMTGIGIPILWDIFNTPDIFPERSSKEEGSDKRHADRTLDGTRKEKIRQFRIRELRRIAVMAFVLLLPCAAAYGINKAAYRLDEGWKDFFSYNNARKEIMDFGMPSYKEHREELNALGIDRTAYNMLTSWTFADPEVFSREVLTQIGGLKVKTEFLNKVNLKNYLIAFPNSFLMERIFYLFLALAVIWLVSSPHRICEWLAVLYEIVLFGALYYYFYIQGRYLMGRVDLPLFTALGLVLVWTIHIGTAGSRLKEALLICLTGALFFTFMVLRENGNFTPIWRWTEEAEDVTETRAGARERLKQVSKRDDRLYLAMVGSISDTGSYGPWDTPEKGITDHIVWLGGWEAYTKGYNEILDAYGVTNPFREMIDNDRVRVICRKTDLLMKYLHAHYDETAKAVQEDKVGRMGIYKIVSGPPAGPS